VDERFLQAGVVEGSVDAAGEVPPTFRHSCWLAL
jgi:hypothetical protein